MPRYSVRTSGGTFILPSNYQVATVDIERDEVRYNFPFELQRGDVVLMRKPSSDLSFEEVLVALWARSPQYREDRRQLFVERGPTLPTTTRLSRIVRRLESVLGRKRMEEIMKEHGYSTRTLYNWKCGRAMFPRNPEVLRAMAEEAGDEETLRWIEHTIRSGSIKRLRVLHPAIMALLARPKGRGKGERKEEKRRGEKVISLGPYIDALKSIYGDEFLEEVVMPVMVTGVTRVEVSAGKGEERRERTGIRKELIGFPSRNKEKRRRTKEKYSGTDRSEEIEDGLRIVKETTLSAFPRIWQEAILSPGDYMLRSLNLGAYLTYLLFPEIRKRSEIERRTRMLQQTIEQLHVNRDLARRLRIKTRELPPTRRAWLRYVRNLLTTPEIMELPYISSEIEEARKVREACPILEDAISEDVWLATTLPLHFFSEMTQQGVFASVESNIRVAEFVEEKLGNESRRIEEARREKRVPKALSWLQARVPTRAPFQRELERVRESFGLESLHLIPKALKERYPAEVSILCSPRIMVRELGAIPPETILSLLKRKSQRSDQIG